MVNKMSAAGPGNSPGTKRWSVMLSEVDVHNQTIDVLRMLDIEPEIWNKPNEPQHDQTRSVRKSVGVLRFSENSVDQTKEGDHVLANLAMT